MIYALVVWIYGVTVAVIPVTFATLAQCEKSGRAFISQVKATNARDPGFACIPIELIEETSP
jgi:hypothetical protein